MHAMQYEMTMPADYDMAVIRDRVARLGHLLDDWGGLGLKAYLMRERGVDGSPVNQYGPFYLWHTVEGMNSFLFGGPFQGLVGDFGRPVVRQWTGLAYEEGRAADTAAGFAVRQRTPVPEGVALAEFAEEAVDGTRRSADRDGAVLAAAGVDTSRWELVRFSLWSRREAAVSAASAASGGGGEVFQVLHLSQPGRKALTPGRQW
ncbi:DUF4865 domain-containing protein [Streptomyces sp. SAT1]|uniref:DUF4865 family protein n=1 Tax=Streptomyces sp. SAT1 TaxID=1849967 RepID=UPI0007DD3E73|nr:DUF4865 family protein [Streptomyces sp. SAT1]ANH90303.1 DUF4865 domain-containing protein [Streptomyces sp. SAT1]